MNVYEFLLTLSGWQWMGVLSLAGMATAAVVGGLEQVANAFRRGKS